MKINWLVRVKNKAWWLAVIPAVAILVQVILAVFDVTWDYTEWVGKIAAIIDAVFVLLALLGIVVDPTVDGWADSERALGYTEPAPNAHESTLVDDHATDDLYNVGGTD